MTPISFSGDNKNVTWLDGKKYAIGQQFLTTVAKMTPSDVQAKLDAGLNYGQIARELAKTMANQSMAASAGFKQLTQAEQDTLTPENLIAYLKAERTYLQSRLAVKQTITLKIGEKGGLSVYGMGRFPITLYKTQWERLIQAVPQIQEFMAAHAAELKEKGE
jgi:hypothetical protein